MAAAASRSTMQVVTPREPEAAGQEAQKSGSGQVKVIFAFVAFFAFMGLLVMGSCAYIAYRAKTKAERIEKAYNENDPGKVAAELGLKGVAPGTDSTKEGSAALNVAAPATPDVAKWKRYTGSTGSRMVPLKAGLMTVRATSQAAIGDHETTIKVDDVSAQEMELQYIYFGPTAKSAEDSSAPVSTVQDVVTTRTVLAEDIANAHEVQMYYSHQDPKVFPGSTSLDVSKEVFEQLKTRGETALTYRVFQKQSAQAALGNLLSAIAGADTSEKGVAPNSILPITCTLRRAAAEDVAFPAILNEKPVELPALFATCQSDNDDLQLYILDDENNPIVLAEDSKLGRFQSQVTKISFPEDKPVNQIEQALQQSGRAQVYGIYFDFASATIRPQSQPILAEIAKAMKDNPAWKVSVNGHTDNIGGDAANLVLSQKRAAAVVEALTTQYHVASNRFTSGGFGASSPIDTNETIEGRARNRRVELVLQ